MAPMGVTVIKVKKYVRVEKKISCFKIHVLFQFCLKQKNLWIFSYKHG